MVALSLVAELFVGLRRRLDEAIVRPSSTAWVAVVPASRNHSLTATRCCVTLYKHYESTVSRTPRFGYIMQVTMGTPQQKRLSLLCYCPLAKKTRQQERDARHT